jgi:predicted nuclease of predicted toxin-antitoxin system
MRLLLDQGLPRSTVEYLRKFGFEADHVGELGMAAASDTKILDFAREEGCVVVTLDAEFHALLAFVVLFPLSG